MLSLTSRGLGACVVVAILLVLRSSSASAAADAAGDVGACPIPKDALKEVPVDVGGQISAPDGFDVLALYRDEQTA